MSVDGLTRRIARADPRGPGATSSEMTYGGPRWLLFSVAFRSPTALSTCARYLDTGRLHSRPPSPPPPRTPRTPTGAALDGDPARSYARIRLSAGRSSFHTEYLVPCRYKLRIIRSPNWHRGTRSRNASTGCASSSLLLVLLLLLLGRCLARCLFRLLNAFSGVSTYDEVVFIFINIQDVSDSFFQRVHTREMMIAPKHQ